jgi:hypothetical protein
MFDTLVANPGWSNDSTSPNGYAAYVNYGALFLPMPLPSSATDSSPALVDPELSAAEVKNLYWGSQYDRLAKLKAQYDPSETLSNPQSIKPASS